MSKTSADNKRIAKNTVFLYVRSIIMLLISLYTSRVVLKVLGVEDFGIYNVVGGMVAMLSILSSTLSSASQRFITYALGKGDSHQLKKVFTTSVSLHFVLGLIIVVLLEILGVWFLNMKMNIPPERLNAARWVLHFSIISFFVNVICVPYNALITAHEKMDAFAYIGILDGVLRLVIVFMLYIIPFDKLIVYSILTVCVSLLIRLIYTVYCKRHFSEANNIKLSIDGPLFKEMFAFCGWNLLGNGSLVLRNQGVDIVLNLFWGVTINAAKGVSNQVQNAVHKLVGDFTTSIKPQLTKSIAIKDMDRAYGLMKNGGRYSFYLMMVFSIPIIINAPRLLSIWLSVVPDYAAAFVRLTMFYLLCDSFSRLLIHAILSQGQIRNYQIVVAGVKLLAVPIVYISLKLGSGPLIGVWINIVLEIVCLVLRLFYTKKLLAFDAFSYLKIIVKCSGVFVLAFIPAALFYKYISNQLVISGAFSLLLTMGCIWMAGLSPNERGLLLSYIKKYFKK